MSEQMDNLLDSELLCDGYELHVSRYSHDITAMRKPIWQYQVTLSKWPHNKHYIGRAPSFGTALKYAMQQVRDGKAEVKE
jgi:hypothetical protein